MTRTRDKFADRFRQVLYERNYKNLQTFSLLCGINRTTLQNYMYGDTCVNIEAAEIIARTLGVSPAWLCGWEG